MELETGSKAIFVSAHKIVPGRELGRSAECVVLGEGHNSWRQVSKALYIIKNLEPSRQLPHQMQPSTGKISLIANA